MTHHAAGLRRLIHTEPANPHLSESGITVLLHDYRGADLSVPDRAMLDYVIKLTLEPSNMVKADVDALKAVGFDDNGILDICQVTAYYAFANRLVDGLGVELEAIHLSDEDS